LRPSRDADDRSIAVDVRECAESVVLDLEQPIGGVERLWHTYKRHRVDTAVHHRPDE